MSPGPSVLALCEVVEPAATAFDSPKCIVLVPSWPACASFEDIKVANAAAPPVPINVSKRRRDAFSEDAVASEDGPSFIARTTSLIRRSARNPGTI
jgi:hypothetical protein